MRRRLRLPSRLRLASDRPRELLCRQPLQDRETYDKHRREQLRRVFALFDLDGRGHVATHELEELGSARRALSHKQSSWHAQKSMSMFAKVDKDGTGTGSPLRSGLCGCSHPSCVCSPVEEEEFVDYFNEKLPRDRDSFQQLIAEYIEAAEYCRRKKLTPKRGGSVGEPSTPFPPKRVPSCGAHDSFPRRLP